MAPCSVVVAILRASIIPNAMRAAPCRRGLGLENRSSEQVFPSGGKRLERDRWTAFNAADVHATQKDAAVLVVPTLSCKASISFQRITAPAMTLRLCLTFLRQLRFLLPRFLTKRKSLPT